MCSQMVLFGGNRGKRDAVATVDALMALPLDNCKFANVVSDEKVVPGSHLMLTSWGVW